MEIELYYTPHTRSSRPRWLLEELAVPYRLRPVDLFGGERNPLHPQILPEKKRIRDIVPFATKNYHRVLRMLAKKLNHNGYLLGKQFTCADIMMGTTLNWLPELLEDHPPLLAYTQRITARPAYQRAIEPISEIS